MQIQEDSNFLLLTKDLNLRLYQLGSESHHQAFTDVVGIDRKKIYSILTKHK